jgi:LPXTG-site transpeptidase (sortase) family protein
MDSSDIMHFKPSDQDGSNPQAAAVARAKIADLPDAYTVAPPVQKEELAKMAAPVSPAADEVKLGDEISGLVESTAGVSLPTKEAVKQNLKKPRIPSKVHPILTAIATFAFLLILFKSPIFLSQLGYLQAKPKTAAPATLANAQTVGPDPIITIPKINVNAPMIYPATAADAPNYDPELENGVVHYPNTALPGQAGNSVIFGHSSNDWWQPGNYKFVFVLLDKLAAGDTFTVNFQSHQYLYQVTGTEVVAPTDVGVLAPTSDAQMTLITCTPPGTSWKRLIVHSKLLTPVDQSSQTASKPNQVNNNGSLPSSAPGIGQSLSKLWGSFTGLFSHGSSSGSSGTSPAAVPGN